MKRLFANVGGSPVYHCAALGETEGDKHSWLKVLISVDIIKVFIAGLSLYGDSRYIGSKLTGRN